MRNNQALFDLTTNLIDYLKYPITGKMILFPVLWEDGETYGKYAIDDWIKEHYFKLPITQKATIRVNVIPIFF